MRKVLSLVAAALLCAVFSASGSIWSVPDWNITVPITNHTVMSPAASNLQAVVVWQNTHWFDYTNSITANNTIISNGIMGAVTNLTGQFNGFSNSISTSIGPMIAASNAQYDAWLFGTNHTYSAGTTNTFHSLGASKLNLSGTEISSFSNAFNANCLMIYGSNGYSTLNVSPGILLTGTVITASSTGISNLYVTATSTLGPGFPEGFYSVQAFMFTSNGGAASTALCELRVHKNGSVLTPELPLQQQYREAGAGPEKWTLERILYITPADYFNFYAYGQNTTRLLNHFIMFFRIGGTDAP